MTTKTSQKNQSPQYQYTIDNVLPVDVAYLVSPWFLFIIVFGNHKHLPHAAILFIMATVNILFVSTFGLVDSLSYIESKYLLMWYDILISIFMLVILLIDKQAWKHALILSFAALCHFMIIYDLTVHSSIVTNFFYAWYDELIITVGILQMAIAKDGITSAFGNIQTLIQRASFYFWCYTKNLSLQKTREAKT